MEKEKEEKEEKEMEEIILKAAKLIKNANAFLFTAGGKY
jgi:hypothetical protein